MDLRSRTGDFEIYVLQFHGHYHIGTRWPDNQLAGLWAIKTALHKLFGKLFYLHSASVHLGTWVESAQEEIGFKRMLWWEVRLCGLVFHSE